MLPCCLTLFQFNVCEFQGGHISVVPKTWIYNDKGVLKCRWTSQLSKVKSGAIPNPNWRIHDIVKLMGPTMGKDLQIALYFLPPTRPIPHK